MSNATTLAGPASGPFISAAEAIRRYPSLNRAKLYRMGLTRTIRVQLLRGTPPRYSSTDIDTLMSAQASEGR